MNNQEKDGGFWATPVSVGLTEMEWLALWLVGNCFVRMLLAFQLGQPVKIPKERFLQELVWKRAQDVTIGDFLGDAVGSLLKQVPDAAEPLPKELAARLGEQFAPAQPASEPVFAELAKAEVAALLMACQALSLLVAEKPDWSSDELQRLAEEWLPKTIAERHNLAMNLCNALDKIALPQWWSAGKWVH